MSDRQMFVVQGSTSVPAEAVSLSDLHLREVSDLEEWVIAHPEILGPDVKIVTVEFNLWESEGGKTARERLDVLGLESSGRLVVAELKRESDSGIHVQAITYAALVAGFTEETLADAHAAFLTKRGNTTTPDEALERLKEDLEADFDSDVLSDPRIVLIAREFPAQVITTAEWLSNRSIDISLIEVQAWRVGEQVAVTFDQIYPVAGVGDALLVPARRRVAQSQKTVAETTRAAAATKAILERGLLADGTPLTFQPTTTIGPELRQAAADWVAENPTRGQAVWRTEGANPWSGSLTASATPLPASSEQSSKRDSGYSPQSKAPSGG